MVHPLSPLSPLSPGGRLPEAPSRTHPKFLRELGVVLVLLLVVLVEVIRHQEGVLSTILAQHTASSSLAAVAVQVLVTVGGIAEGATETLYLLSSSFFRLGALQSLLAGGFLGVVDLVRGKHLVKFSQDRNLQPALIHEIAHCTQEADYNQHQSVNR